MRTFDLICLSVVAGVIFFVLAVTLLDWIVNHKKP